MGSVQASAGRPEGADQAAMRCCARAAPAGVGGSNHGTSPEEEAVCVAGAVAGGAGRVESPVTAVQTQHQGARKALSAKYKASGVAIPKRELEERAELEIVAEEQENERNAAEDDWRNAEAAFLNKLDEEEEERVMKANADERVRREKSAIRVQCAFRMFAARKVLRQEIRALVVKEFDAKKQAAVYRNTFSNERSLQKPFGLGSEELEYPDQWFLIEDSTIGEHFFYNPRRMLQSWEKPDECRLCGMCKVQEFAAFWNAQVDTYCCGQCYERAAHDQPGFSPDAYFPYDGARPNGY